MYLKYVYFVLSLLQIHLHMYVLNKNNCNCTLYFYTKLEYLKSAKLDKFWNELKKCALCNKETLQINLNYNFTSVSLKWYVNVFKVYLVWKKCILNKWWHSFFYWGDHLTCTCVDVPHALLWTDSVVGGIIWHRGFIAPIWDAWAGLTGVGSRSLQGEQGHGIQMIKMFNWNQLSSI